MVYWEHGCYLLDQFIIQAITSTKSAKEAKKSSLYAAALCLSLALAVGIIGVVAH
jgi:solute:Na+ symporter, SSS family